MSRLDAEIGRGEPDYPARLAPLADAPEHLYLKGAWRELELAVAIVGARGARREGLERARALAARLAERGAQIVSGGALGVDAAAHEGALQAGGHTVAVLAHGLDIVYPARNEPLFEAALDAGGALLSPYPRGRPPRRFHFRHRNRVMAGMVDAVVVAECRSSSGALDTARAARAYGRAVCALPGSPGAEALIAQGAGIAEDAADVEAAVRGAPRRPEPTRPTPGSDEGRVLAVLRDREALDEAEIAARAGVSIRSATRALAELEIAGLAVLAPGRTYARGAAGQTEVAS